MAESAIREGEQALYESLAQVRLCAACALLASGGADHASEHLAPVITVPSEARLATSAGRMSQCTALASAAPYEGSDSARSIAAGVTRHLDAGAEATQHPLAIGPGRAR